MVGLYNILFRIINTMLLQSCKPSYKRSIKLTSKLQLLGAAILFEKCYLHVLFCSRRTSLQHNKSDNYVKINLNDPNMLNYLNKKTSHPILMEKTEVNLSDFCTYIEHELHVLKFKT